MKITFKQVSNSDLNLLKKISCETFKAAFEKYNSKEDMQLYLSEHLNINTLESELNQTDCEFYFAQIENSIAGYIKLNYYKPPNPSYPINCLEIQRIYVISAWQNKKIGQKLFQFALAKGLQKKHTHLWLAVWEKNIRAINFYKNQGMYQISNQEFILGKDIQKDIIFSLEISAALRFD